MDVEFDWRTMQLILNVTEKHKQMNEQMNEKMNEQMNE